ncbi:type II secretion system F family protein [Streptomyces sp. NRRL S-350]|uniref:type II secretion system F family protein n=1 Tax=Streptomyces sp. NRRL S-350 TaxID=1463902 RepID=UPI000AF03E3C|nr:type II secretion system F family protein [Streptomyces sp. NRRL S-350]
MAVLPLLAAVAARAPALVRGRVRRRRAFAGPGRVGERKRAGPLAPGAERRRRLALAACAGCGMALLVGGGTGLVVGVLVAVGAHRWSAGVRTPEARSAAREEELLTRQLPLSAELLAACLGSAALPSEAVSAVGRSVGAPMGPRLVAIGAELSLGAPPELCWGRLAEQHPVLAPLARCLVRTSLGGAPAAEPLIGLAQGQRTAAARAAHTRVRRAAVLATAPLGLCFLPAFVLIGVVPVVIGLTSGFAQAM